MNKFELLGQNDQQERSSIDIMREIEDSLHEPLPEPPEGATWKDKEFDQMSLEEKVEANSFYVQYHIKLATRPQLVPDKDHPRYGEYQRAKRDWESIFRLSARELLNRFTI